MVTNNLETDIDVSNGARGEIVNMILHPNEPPLDDQQSKIELKFLSVCILAKLGRTRARKLEGLDECVIPIEPTSTNYHINMFLKDGKKLDSCIRFHGLLIPRTNAPLCFCRHCDASCWNVLALQSLRRSSGRRTIHCVILMTKYF